jgi:hypothetical protein
VAQGTKFKLVYVMLCKKPHSQYFIEIFKNQRTVGAGVVPDSKASLWQKIS